jgi:hypothetical protein
MEEAEDRVGPFPVYVPSEGSSLLSLVLPASAIVGFPLESDSTHYHLFYEGNRYRSEALRRFADRANLAAGRCRWFRFDPQDWERLRPGEPPPRTEYGYATYPTSAEAVVAVVEAVHVASYDEVRGQVTPLSAPLAALLHAWTGTSDPLEYLATGPSFEQRRQEGGSQ